MIGAKMSKELWVSIISYVLALTATAFTFHNVGYWKGWDRGIQESTERLMKSIKESRHGNT